MTIDFLPLDLKLAKKFCKGVLGIVLSFDAGVNANPRIGGNLEIERIG